jgi:capsular exopolysaccharide synthesis family protein
MSFGIEDDIGPGRRRNLVNPRFGQELGPGVEPPVRLVETPIEEEADPEDAFNLLHYWHLAVKYRWLLAAALVLGLAAGVVVTLLTTPVYRATATVQIDEEPQKVVAVESQRPVQSGGADKFYQTQYELLKSRALAQRVAQGERLGDDPRFMGQWSRQPASAKPSSMAARAAREEKAAALISDHLQIEPVRLSRIVKVSYDSPDPVVAAKVANAVASNYITWNLERRYNASADAREFLENRLKQTREALEASQRRGNAYAQKNELITIGGTEEPGGEKGAATGESLAAADLASINQQLAAATAARIQAEQRWRQATATPDMALPEILTNAAAQSIKAARDTAWAEYQQNLRIYKPDWPAMVDAKRKIDALDQQLAAQANAIRNSLKTEYEIAANNEAQFRAEVERRKRELLDSQSKRVEQSFINTDIATSKSLYEGMLASYKEIGIAGAIGENNISFVDRAEVPKLAIKPQPRQILIRFGLLGLAVGGLIAFLLDRFDTTVKVPEDIERKLHLPLLGAIPVLPKDLSPIRALEDPKSALSEAYYSVRTALQFSTEEGVPSSLLITSPRPAEGKTTSSLAIATGFARLGLRVLLVDGDMRDPSLHKILARDNGVGLSNLLAGGPDMTPAVQPTAYKNLNFLACGPLPPNPAELLGGGKMRAFLKAAKVEFDLVVIDGPPVMGLADAPQLASVVAGAVLVVEAARTKRDLAKAAIRRLRVGHVRLVGAILTKFDLKKAGYAYGYAYGYGYGYGYGYDYGAKPQPALARARLLPWMRGRHGRA